MKALNCTLPVLSPSTLLCTSKSHNCPLNSNKAGVATMDQDNDTVQLQNLPAESTDIFSLTDQVLAERLEFIEEIGFGNWGSVWLCKPKPLTTQDGVVRPVGQKLAVKLVHRSKTSTTAARVRSLWNEMKIVRNFKSDPHPSIIPFHSFIITPSYALITMTYHPTLIPVEVEESKAREWFQFMLSAVEFLHKRGVVHNDIKPANILISSKNIPVLVDFGFAEKYDMDSDTAFHSNLSYGTPEYLSPERARGLPHDTRKSDVWSLGVTFFEILVGRTPFEHSDGEQFNTSEDLEKYWSRTLRGKWVGSWKLSKGMEKLLQRMISPNADLRCTAMQAMADSFWKEPTTVTTHKRASSYNTSIVFEKEIDNLLSMTPPSWKNKNKENVQSPPGLDTSDVFRDTSKRPALSKSKSQPKVAASKLMQPRKRVPAAPVIDLSPIKASPTPSPYTGTTTAKENIMSFNRLAATVNGDKRKNRYQNKEQDPSNVSMTSNARRPFSVLTRENVPRPVSMLSKKPTGHSHGAKAVKVLGDLRNTSLDERDRSRESTSAKDRVREWEREKERLREMQRLEEMEKERNEIYQNQMERKMMERDDKVKRKAEEGNADAAKENEKRAEKKNASVLVINIPEPRPKDSDKENMGSSTRSPVLPMFNTGTPLTQQVLNIVRANTPPPSTFSRITKDKNTFRHSIKASIDKTVQFCKSSTLAQVASGRSTPARGFSLDVIRPNHEPQATTKDGKEAWEIAAEESLPEISPLPVIKNAAETEKMAADARNDRMAIWMRNVEKVVEDAKQNFAAASAPQDIPLPPLPPPLSRDRSQTRPSRLPRRVLAASQIFQADENGNITPMMDQTMNSAFLTATDISKGSIQPPMTPAPAQLATPEKHTSPLPSEGPSQMQIPEIYTPSRQRRATVSTRSPEPAEPTFDLEIQGESPSKRREKSKSHGNLFQFQRHIAPISFLEAELNKVPPPAPTPRLSQVIDRSLIIAPPLMSRDNLLDCDSVDYNRSRSFDELTSSPLHVEPYPQRQRASEDLNVPDTPSRHRIEGVYDRFLMATSGVKRLGKGYQSDNIGPVHGSNTLGPVVIPQHKSRIFHSTRRPMPPPVSSEDQCRPNSVDELGVMVYADLPVAKDEGNATVSLVRKAIKLMVPKASASKRMSRMG